MTGAKVEENLKVTAFHMASGFRYDYSGSDFNNAVQAAPLGLERVLAMAQTIYEFLSDTDNKNKKVV